MEAAPAPVLQVDEPAPVVDGLGRIVQDQFLEFLEDFPEEVTNKEYKTYIMQITEMELNHKSTLVVDYQHVLKYDEELARAIKSEYYRSASSYASDGCADSSQVRALSAEVDSDFHSST